MTTLWFDCETYSEADLTQVGTHAYAEHPSTEITVVQWAIDDGEPKVYDMVSGYQSKEDWDELMDALSNDQVTVVAHNSHFDRTILRHCWGIDVPIERWQDTMVKAMSHGLPGSLDKIGQILGVSEDKAKDKRGRELIQLFCKPRPKNSKLRRATCETHPKEWAEFLQYSYQDIVAMREIDRKLPNWNYRTDSQELKLWHLDQVINDRGIAIDTELVDAAIEATTAEQARLKGQVQDETDDAVDGPSKSGKLLAYILAEYGVDLPDLKADTLRRRLEDPELPEPVKLLISLRLESAKASTAKYKAAKRAVSSDGRLRNTMQFSGAQRTGRWAHRLFQPGNMPRPDIKLMAEHFGVSVKDLTEPLIELYESQGVAALKGGFAELVFDNVLGLAANLVRGVIVAPPGRKLVVADLANIEGRGLAYLAGEKWKLKAFREYDKGTGPDLYNLAYMRSFGVAGVEDIPKGGRQIGKVQELGLGYQGGVAAFLTFAAVYNMDLNEMADAVWVSASPEVLEAAQGMLAWTKKKKRSTFGLSDKVFVACEALKAMWRTAHPATVELWDGLEQAVRRAVADPGSIHRVGQLAVRKDGSWLRIRLPSGRYLCYLRPEVGEGGQITYFGVNQYTRQWGRIKTYGGKVVENVVQAWARDVLAANMPLIDACGYEIVLSVHDELPTECPDSDDFTVDALCKMMTHRPPWAQDCPLAAAGFETYRYAKR